MAHAFGNKTYRNILIAVILVLGAAFSIFISALSYQADKNLMRAQFTEAAENRYSALRRELESNLDALEALQALYYHSEKDADVNRFEFRNFTGYILKQRTSIQALEWIPRVPDSRREAYERAAQGEGFPGFQIAERIAQGTMKRAEKRKKYFPVYFVEPYKGNEIALGFDLASNPIRLEALEAAGRTGKMLATARITLVQEKENQLGFIVFAPVYSKRALLNSDRARADALEGFALGVFRVKEIVEKSTSYLKPEGIDFFIYDASAPEKERFLYTHESRTRKTPILNKEQPETHLRETMTLDVAGRKWQIIYSATPGFIAARTSSRPWVVFFAGLALTGFVAGFLVSSTRHAKQIEASEKKLKALFNAVNDAIMIVEPSGRILDVNNVTCERLGYMRDELLQMTPRDFDTPEYAPRVGERIAEVSRRGSAIFETAWVTHDSRIIPIEISARAIDYDGKPAFLSVARDITDRKRMEKKLVEAGLFTEQVIRSAGEGIIVYGRDLRYQGWNPYMERLTGISAEKVVGKDPRAVFPFLLDTGVLECIQKTLEGQLSDDVEFEYVVPETGHSGWVSHTNAQLRNAQGEIIGVIATVRDITGRKQAEVALKKSEEFIRSILETVDEGFIVIDRDYRIISANRAFTEQTGMALRDMTGRHCFEISHHCIAPCYEEGEMCAVKHVLDTGESHTVIHANHDIKGVPVSVETKAYPLSKDESGKVMTVIEIIVDITEKKKTEERLKLLNECFLEFGPDPLENIKHLVCLCGKFMGGTCALYNRLEDERLCSWGQWNVPPDYNSADVPEGHICYDVIKDGSDEVVVIRNLSETVYARTDPNVTRYNLQTYVGIAVKFSGAYVGSLCVVYQKDFLPGEDDKRILGIIASAIATEEKRKKAEESVLAAAMEWSESFDAMADGVSILSADYTIMNVNQSLCKLLGKTSEELIGKKCYQVFHGKDCPIAACPLESPKGKAQREYGEFYEPALDKWLSVSTSPVLDEAGSMLKAVHTVRDVTERRQAEEELAKLAHKISLILNSAGEGIYGVDFEGKVTFINPAAARMLGYEVEELLGSQSHEAWHHHNPDGTALPVEKCALTEVLKEGTPGAGEDVVFWKKDGTRFPVEYTSTPMFEAGKLLGAVVTFKDITSQLLEEREKKKLEAQLRHAQKMEAVGTLAGGVAHDFNNILNVIIGYGSMALDRQGDDPIAKEQLNEVLGAADRAADLTKRLLAFSRKQAVDMKPVNVNEIILGMEKMLSRIIGEDIVFATELVGGKMFVMADCGQMEQVLMNLISNARDAMPKGGRLTISTGIKEVDDAYISAYGYGKTGTYALICVTDTGSGMDAETQKRVFEPFFTTKGIGEGTGLGLAIAYGIIKKHDGYIHVYSEVGKGTTFKILLPVIKEETSKRHGVEAAVPIKGGTETILIAEDDASLRNLSRIVLESFGYSVITAEDGEDAITKYKENRDNIHLVVLDMVMPKKNGKEAYEEIRKISRDVKAFFMSGYAMDIITKRDLLDERMDYILKPAAPKELLKKVRDALDR